MLFSLIAFFSFFLDANAAVTALNYYRMGDSDSGAVAGNLCNSSTIDSIVGKNLTKGNNPSYSSSITAVNVGGNANLLSISYHLYKIAGQNKFSPVK